MSLQLQTVLVDCFGLYCLVSAVPCLHNRPFAQLLPGLEMGHPVTVGHSPAYDFSVSDEQKAVFLVSVSDCSVCDSLCR